MSNEPRLPWMIPIESVPCQPLKPVYAATLTDHMYNTNYDTVLQTNSKMTNIMCTIGPSSEMPVIVESLLDVGMRVCRIHMIHSDISYTKQVINSIRMATNNFSSRLGMLVPIAIALEVHGPEIRTGKLEQTDPILLLIQDETIAVTTDPDYYNCCTKELLYVDYEPLLRIMKPGHIIEIDSATIALYVRAVKDDHLVCTVIKGGKLGNCKIVTLYDHKLEWEELSSLTIKDVNFALQVEADFIIMKRIGAASHIKAYRDILGETGKHIKLIAKIRTMQGMKNLDEIIDEADGILFSKHDLSLEIPVENVLNAQKHIISHCNKLGKPVISEVYTVHTAGPIKACSRSVSDAAAIIIDGIHCTMISHETAIGNNPIESTNLLKKICCQAELSLWHRQQSSERNLLVMPPAGPSVSIAIGAVEVATKCCSSAIVVLTTTGKSAIEISKFLPRCPIISISRYGRTARQLQIWRGIHPLHYIYANLSCWVDDVNLRLNYGISYGKLMGFIQAGDSVVLVHGYRPGSGFTNTIRVVYASTEDLEPCPIEDVS